MNLFLTLESFINQQEIDLYSSDELASKLSIPSSLAYAYTNLFNMFLQKYKYEQPKFLYEIKVLLENELFDLEHDISPRKYKKTMERLQVDKSTLIDSLKKMLLALENKSLFTTRTHWIDSLDNVYFKNYYDGIAITSDGVSSFLFYNNKIVGKLITRGITKIENKQYLSIKLVEIDIPYRGKGYGFLLYKALLDKTPYDGLCSYQPDRSNKKQVPSIYKKLNYREVGDYWLIDKTI